MVYVSSLSRPSLSIIFIAAVTETTTVRYSSPDILPFGKTIEGGSWKILGPTVSDDLIKYFYDENNEAKINFGFLLRHNPHAKADFILMLNDAHTIDVSALERLPNVSVIEWASRCYHLGGYDEILTPEPQVTERYERFMFLNASLRGPFFPSWANDIRWSDAYLDKLDDRTKIVSMTWNCANGIDYPPQLQSRILAVKSRDAE